MISFRIIKKHALLLQTATTLSSLSYLHTGDKPDRLQLKVFLSEVCVCVCVR